MVGGHELFTGAETHLVQQEVIELVRKEADTLVVFKDVFLQDDKNC